MNDVSRFAVFILCAVQVSPKVTYNGILDEKIIGGKTEHVDSAKFMTQVVVFDTKSAKNAEVSTCGGTLISTTHVLTAGHCAGPPAETVVFVGSSDYMKTGKRGSAHSAKDIKIHPKYAPVYLKNGNSYATYDVAVIKLTQAVILGEKTAVITITTPHSPPRTGTKLNIAGWGIYKPNSDFTSRKLRGGQYAVLSPNECSRRLGSTFTAQEICTSSRPVSAFCDGDSGGPGYVGNVQYGIVSWGDCGKNFFPSVLTNLADPEVNSFIQNMLKTM